MNKDMENQQELYSDLAIPPGDYLREVIAELGIPQTDLAIRMGRPAQAINEIIAGGKAITADTALQLEQTLGVGAHIWNGLEARYQLVKARNAQAQQLAADTKLVSQFPYPEMAKLKLVQPTRKRHEKVVELRRFFWRRRP